MRSVLRVKVEKLHEEASEVLLSDEFRQSEITVGRNPDNDVVIPDSSVSGNHAKLTVREAVTGEIQVFIRDCNSSNGTFLDGGRLPPNTDVLVEPETPLLLAGFVLSAGFVEAPDSDNQLPKRTEEELKAYKEQLRIRSEVHSQLVGRLDLRKKSAASLADKAFRKKAQGVVEVILNDFPEKLPKDIDKDELIESALSEGLGLGPIDALLEDEECTEILVNCFDEIYAETGGAMNYTDMTFSGDDAVLLAIERILAPTGRQIDKKHPMVDVRLKDGSRVCAVLRPLALKGPCITIRKPATEPLVAEQLVRNGSLSGPMSDFLKLAVESQLNTIISGGTGSGKTTLLNMLAGYIPNYQRVITVEEAAELRLVLEHLVSFETRPPDSEGKDEIEIRELIQNALLMRPDRIIIGDCRGDAVLEVLEVMHAGHEGSMTTGLANTPDDMIRRLETMVLASGVDMPIRAVREQIAGAFELAVQLTRFPDGSRRVTAISEVVGIDHDTGTVCLEDIFRFRQDGLDEQGRVCGTHFATGHVPRFFRQLQTEGRAVDEGLFQSNTNA